MFLVTMPTWSIILIILVVLVGVILALIYFIPSLKPKREKKDPKDFAQENVDTFVVKPKLILPDDDKLLSYLTSKEKELNIIFTDIDIECLLIQLRQDFKDNHK